MPNQLFSIDLLQPKVVDVVSDDKIYPPHFKTVQNRQPIPEGAFKKRDGLYGGDLSAALSQNAWECQGISPFFQKGSSIKDTIGAFSDVYGTVLCHLVKWLDTGGTGTWSQITHSTSTTPKSSVIAYGSYYFCNALSTVDNVITPVLVMVKAESTNAAYNSATEKNCCFAIYRAPSDGAITIRSIANYASTNASEGTGSLDGIKTLNWQSAMCAEYHLNKLWVGGLREPLDPDAIASGSNELVNRHNRIRWSKTGDWDTNYTGTGAGQAGSWGEAGTGYLDVPIVGEHRVVGMRQFRGQLYILTTSDLFVLTGTTSAQFGLTRICSSPSAVGQTMWASDNYLFWADANGIQQFNGSQIKNVTEDTVPVAYRDKQIEQYDILGTTASTGYGKVPTAFINEKLKIYGIHWPNLDDYTGAPDLPGKETWLYNYKSQAFSTYVYTLESGYNQIDVNYVSDYHDSGFMWAGMSTSYPDWPTAYRHTFEPSTPDYTDPGGAVTTILETGDLNLAALNGFSYEDASRLTRLDLYVVPDSSTDVTYKLDITIDNVAQTQQTVTVSASSGATQPQYVVVPLPTMKTGSFFRIKLTEDTASVKGDLRRADLFYEVMFKRGGARK